VFLDLTWFLTGRNSISPKAGKLLFSLITWSDILIYAQHKFIKVALMIGWQQLLISSFCVPYFSVYKVFRTFNSNPKSILINSWWWWSDDKKTSKSFLYKKFIKYWKHPNLTVFTFFVFKYDINKLLMIIFFSFCDAFIVSSDKMKKSYWFFSLQWLVLSYTNVGCFYLQKGVLSNNIHFTAVGNQTFPFCIKVGLASYILVKARKPRKPINSYCLCVLITCS